MLISLYPWMLSLTPPALHSLHSICSGGVSVSGGALGLFSLDVCMCQQGGEVSDRTRGKIVWLLREPKTCWAQGLEGAYIWWEFTSKGEMHSVGVSALFSSWFSLRFWHECVDVTSRIFTECYILQKCEISKTFCVLVIIARNNIRLTSFPPQIPSKLKLKQV